MVCDKCGKDIRTPEHQLDYTWYLCHDCYKRFIKWINDDTDKWVPIESVLPDAKSKLPQVVITKDGDIGISHYKFFADRNQEWTLKQEPVTHWLFIPDYKHLKE